MPVTSDFSIFQIYLRTYNVLNAYNFPSTLAHHKAAKMSSSHNEPEKGDQPRAEQLRARRMLSSEAPQISRRVNDENSNSNPKRRKIENPAGRQAHPAPPAHMYSADNRHSPTPLEVESPMRHRSPLAESNHRSQNRPSSSRNGPVFDDSASEASPEPATPPRILPQRPNIFPHFRDGDTLIVSPTGKQWKLHSIVLSKASPVLANILKRTNPEHITKRQQEEGRTVKWKLNMVREHSASDIDPEGLRFKAFKAVVGYSDVSPRSEGADYFSGRRFQAVASHG